eukprot:2508231-Prymnesium_polylepis.1
MFDGFVHKSCRHRRESRAHGDRQTAISIRETCQTEKGMFYVGAFARAGRGAVLPAVSYTHLTLPTICSV